MWLSWDTKNGGVFCFISCDFPCSKRTCSTSSFWSIFAFAVDPSNEEKGYSFSWARLAVGCEAVHFAFPGSGLPVEGGMALVCI